jgi:uncharacterized LabA/DUF88 family protein
MRLAHPLPNGPQTVEVVKTEEKGSDVNLATYLLVDAFDKDCDVAAIISNDSDLKSPIELVRSRLGIHVGILNPHQNRSRALYNMADFYKPIRKGPLGASQFPPTLTDAHGVITKPAAW